MFWFQKHPKKIGVLCFLGILNTVLLGIERFWRYFSSDPLIPALMGISTKVFVMTSVIVMGVCLVSVSFILLLAIFRFGRLTRKNIILDSERKEFEQELIKKADAKRKQLKDYLSR